MIKTIVAVLLALGGALGRGAGRRHGKVTLDASVVARSLREEALQARIDQLTVENEQLAELAARRFELLRLGCLAQGLTVAEQARDVELLQAMRASALQYQRGVQRMRHELAARDDALAALGTLALHEQVGRLPLSRGAGPGQYRPDELVQIVAARQRAASGRGRT